MATALKTQTHITERSPLNEVWAAPLPLPGLPPARDMAALQSEPKSEHMVSTCPTIMGVNCPLHPPQEFGNAGPPSELLWDVDLPAAQAMHVAPAAVVLP